MSLVSVFFASRQAVVLGASACVALSTVLVSLHEGNQAPQVASNAPGAMSVPDVPRAAPILAAPKMATPKMATIVIAATGTARKPATTPDPAVTPPQAGPVAQLQAPQAPVVTTPGAQEIRLGGVTDDPTRKPPLNEIVVASADPEASPALQTAPLGKPKLGPAADASPRSHLKFDLVRVDKAGSAVVAGKAEPGQMVVVNVDGAVTAQAETNDRGGFVVLFDLPASAQPQVITLSTSDSNGTTHISPEQVIVVGRTVPQPQEVIADAAGALGEAAPALEKDVAPAIILTSNEGVKVVQPAAPETDAPEVMANVSLDLISYDTSGEVVLSGRSKPDQHVRVYLDGKPVKTNPVAKDGSWRLSLPEVDAGRYTLRIDELDSAGQVTSRLETPFQKEVAEDVKRVASNVEFAASVGTRQSPRVQKITIQRGATLWALAEQNYGKGDLYMQIFNANRDAIRDPDLIYPGQIFKIPE